MEIKFLLKWLIDYSCVLECLTGSCIFKCEKVTNYISENPKTSREKASLLSQRWIYSEEGRGRNEWDILYKTCSSNYQSPVDIDTDTTFKSDWIQPFTFLNFDLPTDEATVRNNGRTVEMTCKNRRSYSIKGGGLDDTFLFRQLHFHWGTSDKDGSEHRINGIQYPLEIHLVFETSNNTKNGRKTLAVMAIFFQVIISAEKNSALDSVSGTLSKIRDVGDEALILNKIFLSDFLPKNRKRYFRYEGSLTTPPCTEGVVWTIFSDTLPISKDQLNNFRQLHLIGQTTEQLSFNHRPVQKLNNRIIWESESIAK